MTDQPGRSRCPGQRRRARAAAARPAAAERGRARGALHRAAGDATTPRSHPSVRRRSSASRAAPAGSGSSPRWSWCIFVHRLLLLRAGGPGDLADTQPARGRGQGRSRSRRSRTATTSTRRTARAATARRARAAIGPVLNDQMKLFTHLNEQYIRNVLFAGGRYVCGNPKSLMPVWDQQNGGPLNYRADRRPDRVPARAQRPRRTSSRDPNTKEPVTDPTGRRETFTGWRDPNFKPAPGATRFPAAGPTRSRPGRPARRSVRWARRRPRRARRARRPAGRTVITITAANIAFTRPTVDAPPAERRSRSSSTTRTPASPTTSRSWTRPARPCSRATSSTASTTRHYDVPGAHGRHVHVRLRRAPEHDRHPDGQVALHDEFPDTVGQATRDSPAGRVRARMEDDDGTGARTGHTPRRRVLFGLLDGDGWSWASLKAAFWFVAIIFLLGYIPDRAYYFTVFSTIDLGINVVSPINLCPPENKDLPCPGAGGRRRAVGRVAPPELALPAAADRRRRPPGGQQDPLHRRDRRPGHLRQGLSWPTRSRTGRSGRGRRARPCPAPRSKARCGVSRRFDLRASAASTPATRQRRPSFILTPDAQTGALEPGSLRRSEGLPSSCPNRGPRSPSSPPVTGSC